MAIDALSDGFVKLCIDPSLNFYDGKCRVLIEGQYVPNPLLAQPIVPDQPIRITSTRYVDEMFTAGSVLAEGLKLLFCMCPGNVDVYALPREDAAGAVKAVYTMTVSGPATSDGTIDIFLGDKQYSVDGVIVTAGDTAADIAAAIAAAIPTSFPYAVTVAGAVITLTAKNGGTVGNFLAPIVNWKQFANYHPSGVAITVAQATAGSGDPAPIDYRAALGDCCYNCYGLLGGDRTWQRGLRDHIRDNWDCTKPQCFGHGYTYNSGTLGQVLAAGDNSAELSRVAVPLNDVNFPWAIVAAYVAKSCCTACDNPELNIQGRTHGVLSCIERPQSCTQPWTYDEVQQLKDHQFVVYGPLTQGGGVLTYPYIFNDVTNYLYDEMNRPNVTFRDASSRRLAAKTAAALATELNASAGLSLYTINTRIPEGVFGTTKRLLLASLHAWAKREVGHLFSEFDNLERDLTLRDDFEVKPPCQGVPCKLHVHLRYRPPCRLNSVNVVMQPKMLDNCTR